jgi:uncharacterized protein (TIGR03382 family)
MYEKRYTAENARKMRLRSGTWPALRASMIARARRSTALSAFSAFVPLAATTGIALGCSAAPPTPSDLGEPTAKTSAPLSTTDAINRAEQWVTAQLHYCQAPYGQADGDSSCWAWEGPSHVCDRQSNPQWDPYRSDCSGFVSWAWNLPAPGRVTGEFAPFQTDATQEIQGSDMQPGDAANLAAGGHIVLFKSWVVQGQSAVFLEEPGCSAAEPYAHEFMSTVTINGSTVHIDYEGEDFVAIRYPLLTAGDAPATGTLDKAACGSITGTATDPDAPNTAVNVKLTFDAPDGMTGSGTLQTTANPTYTVDMPLHLMDGASHAVYAYGADVTTQALTLLAGAPANITCAAPNIPSGVKRFVVSNQSLSDWKIDVFTMVAAEPKAIADAYTRGNDLPAAPTVVQADDGTPDVWVVDGSERRHVTNPASMTAWNFTATKWPAAQVNAMTQGPDWPASPFIFAGLGEQDIWVVDVAQSSSGGSSGGSGSGGSGGSSGNGGSNGGGSNGGSGGSSGNNDNGGGGSGGGGGCNAGGAGPTETAAFGGLLLLAGILARRRAR